MSRDTCERCRATSQRAGDGNRTRIVSLGTAPAVPLTGSDLRATVALSASTGQVGTWRVARLWPGRSDAGVAECLSGRAPERACGAPRGRRGAMSCLAPVWKRAFGRCLRGRRCRETLPSEQVSGYGARCDGERARPRQGQRRLVGRSPRRSARARSSGVVGCRTDMGHLPYS